MRQMRLAIALTIVVALAGSAGAATIGPWPDYLNTTGYAWEDKPITNYTSGPVYIEAPDLMRMPGPTGLQKNDWWLPYGTYWGGVQWQERLAAAKLLGTGDWTDPLDPVITPLTFEPTVVHAKMFDPYAAGKQGWALIIFDDTGKVLDFGIRPFDASKKVRAMQYDGSTWTASRYAGVRPSSKGGTDDYYTIDLLKNPDGTITWSMMAYETLDDFSKITWWFTGRTTVAYGNIAGGIHLETSQTDTTYATNYKWTQFVLSSAPSVATVRGLGDGASIVCHGVVTMKDVDYIYIEASDRSVGIRVNTTSAVNEGDLVEVDGTIGFQNGEKVINMTGVPTVLSADMAFPEALDLRSRDVGGASYGVNNPGVTDGRGALNVGLRVKVCGLVTAQDPNIAPEWFYVWDGANRTNEPLDDGTGNNGVRVQSTLPVVPGTDWVDIDGVVSANDTIVSGRTIPVILPRTITFVTSFSTLTDAVPWDTIYPGSSGVKADYWNLIGVPAVPKSYDPMTVFAPYDPSIGNLWRYEAGLESFIPYDMWTASFGGLLAGDGYWLDADSDWAVSFEASSRSDDQWVTLPLGDNKWTLIGQPFNHNTWWTDVKVHNGAEVKTMEDAVTAGWLASTAWWLDNDTGSWRTLDFPYNFPNAAKLAVWHGYYVQSATPDLSLIVPASPNAGSDYLEVPF